MDDVNAGTVDFWEGRCLRSLEEWPAGQGNPLDQPAIDKETGGQGESEGVSVSAP